MSALAPLSVRAAVLFSDDFEDGTLSPWTVIVGDPGDAGVNDDTSQSGSQSMFLRFDQVAVASPVIDTSGSNATLEAWIRRGDNAFSNYPENNEDLQVYYLDDTGTYTLLETFQGGGTAGEVFTPSYSLPADGRHANFRVAFLLTQSNGFDYWHIDDVTVSQSGSPFIGTGTGLTGAYCNRDTSNETVPCDSDPDVTRIDPVIEFASGDPGWPAPGIGDDTFSVRWTGEIQAQFDEDYTFHALHDDGVRIWVGGVQVIDEYDDQGAAWSDSGTPISLERGERYEIVIEYYENGGDQDMTLAWSSASTALRTTVPQTQLYPTAGVSATLLAEWRMDESTWNGTSGEVVDQTGNGHDGTAQNGAQTDDTTPALTGDPGTCGYGTFDGSDDHVSVAGLSDTLNGTATLTFWIRTTQTGNNTGWQAPGVTGVEEAGGADDIFWGWIDAAGRIGISVSDDYANDQKSTSAINDGAWHHVALTRDAGSGDTRVYVDGVLETSGNSGTGTIGNAFSSIGRIEDTGGTPEYLDGDLDEVRIYDEVLDTADVQSVMGDTHACAFCAADADLSDSFEDGDLNPWQSQGGPSQRAGVSTQTAGDGSRSMFLRHDQIYVRSPNIDFSAVTSAQLSLWVQRGSNAISDHPEGGENLELQYRTSSNNWATLDTFPGGGTPEEIFEPTYNLPADAFHSNFRLRFHHTGGSGSDFDYWHIDNICLTSIGSGGVEHFAVGHSGTAVTCGAEAITITGHNPGDQPTDPGNVTMQLDTSTGEGTWAGVIAGSGALGDATAGDGAATYTWPGNGETSVTLAFNYTTVTPAEDPEVVNFNVNGGNEGSGEDPDLVVSRSGFRITDGSGNAVTIPEQIAGKPTDTAPGAISLALQAIRASDNDPGVCEPYFDDGDDVEVELGGECSDPGTCAGNALEVTNNGNTTAVATSDDDGGTGAAAYTPVTLRFGANAEAPLVLEYDDAGRVQLHARHNPIDNGTGTPPVVEYVTGSSNPWVTRPFGFEVDVPADDGTTGAGGTILAVAGDDFDTTVRTVAWQAADDGDDDGQPDAGADLTGNATTPNFGNEAAPETVTLTPLVAAPAGGSDGGLTGALFDSFGSGSETHGVSWSEVGHVHLDAGITDGSYLGGGDATGRADTVGRFIPADFDVAVAADGDLDAACNVTYTYTGQAAGYVSTMEPQLTITARNRSGGTTTNYRDAYARLAAAGIDVAEPAADGTETGLEGSPVAVTGNIDTGSLVANGDGTLTHTFADTDRFTYDKVNNARIDPFEPDIDLDVTAVADTDGVAADPAILPVTVEPAAAHEIRFGRLVVESAAGSELAPIGQPVRAEYWSSSTWQPHADDSCTSLALATGVRLDNDQGGPVDGTQPIPVGGGSTELTTNTPDPVNLAGGEAVLTFAETGDGNTGWVDTTLTLNAGLPWLRHDWDDADGGGDGPYDDLPVGRVTFGIHSGNSNWIHFRRTQ